VLAIEAGFVNDIQFTAPLISCRVIQLKFQACDMLESRAPVVLKLFLISKHRALDDIARRGAYELSLVVEMLQHSIDVASVPTSNPSLGKDHYGFVSHLHHLGFRPLVSLYLIGHCIVHVTAFTCQVKRMWQMAA